MKRLLAALLFCLASAPAWAICASSPFNLTNGQTADATQVMANFNNVLLCANTLLAPRNSPTFTGSITLPDGATYNASGLTSGSLTSTTLNGTLLLTGTISGGTLQSPTLSGAIVSAATISGGTLQNVTLSGTTANAGTVTGGTFQNSTFANALVNAGTITGGMLEGVVLNAGTISGGTLQSPTINNCTGCSAFASQFISTQQAIPSAGTTLTVAHTATGGSAASGGFVGVPFGVIILAHNVTADSGYVSGDEVALPPVVTNNLSVQGGVAAYADATNINIVMNVSGDVLLYNKSTGAAAVITAADWKLIVKAWK